MGFYQEKTTLVDAVLDSFSGDATQTIRMDTMTESMMDDVFEEIALSRNDSERDGVALEFIEKIGEGGMGVVEAAKQGRHQGSCAECEGFVSVMTSHLYVCMGNM